MMQPLAKRAYTNSSSFIIRTFASSYIILSLTTVQSLTISSLIILLPIATFRRAVIPSIKKWLLSHIWPRGI